MILIQYEILKELSKIYFYMGSVETVWNSAWVQIKNLLEINYYRYFGFL